MTWTEGVEKYFRDYSPLHHRPETARGSRRVLTSFGEFLKERLGGKETELAELSRDLIEGYQHARLKAGLSRSSVNVDVRYIRAFLRWCLDREMISKDPSKAVKLLSVTKRDKEDRYVHESDIRRAVEWMEQHEDPKYADLLIVISNVGLRLGEAFHLSAEDVNLETDKPFLWVRNKETHMLKDQEDRRVGLNSLAVAALRRRLEAVNRAGLLFPSKGGTVLDQRNTRDVLYRARNAIGAPTMKFYGLRHTFGTKACATIGDVAAAAAMGHSSPETTRKNYLHSEHIPVVIPAEIGGALQIQATRRPPASPAAPVAPAARGGRRQSSTATGRRVPAPPRDYAAAFVQHEQTIPPKPKAVPDPLRQEEVDRLLAHLDRVRAVSYADFARLAVHAGLRLTEILRLTAKDVDIERRSILIRPRAGSPHEEEGGLREVPLDKAALAIIERALGKAKETGTPDAALFPSTWADLAIRVKKLGEKLAESARVAEVPKATWQTLREFFAWRAAERMAPEELAPILGIKEASGVDRFYAGRRGLKLIPGSRPTEEESAAAPAAREAQ